MNNTLKTRTIQQIGEPCESLEHCYDVVAGLKMMPGHVFSYVLTDSKRVVMLFECIATNELMPGQDFVDLGEPIYAGSLPDTHAITSVDLEIKDLKPSGEVIGTYVITLPLIPARPIDPMGQNRIVVTVTETDVPKELLYILRNRKMTVELSYVLGTMHVIGVRGMSRPAIKFSRAFNPVLEERYPRRR